MTLTQNIQQTALRHGTNNTIKTYSVLNTKNRIPEICSHHAHKHAFCKIHKGNTTVVISTDELDSKLQDFISHNAFTKLKVIPLENIKNTIKQFINKAKHIMTQKHKLQQKQMPVPKTNPTISPYSPGTPQNP